MARVFFWEYPISGDTAAHDRRGGGPATDYETPMGTPVHAPIAGKVTRRWFADSGHTLDIDNGKYRIRLCHLKAGTIRTGWRLWRTIIAYSGNSGVTSGPHVHGYVIIKKTGKRVSFTEWLRDYVHKGKPKKLPAATRAFLAR